MRQMIWVKSEHWQGWACSECDWAFDDDDPPEGDTINEMARNYVSKRDKAFASHVCSEPPKKKDEGRRTKDK